MAGEANSPVISAEIEADSEPSISRGKRSGNA